MKTKTHKALQIVFGLFISVIFLYLTFSEVDFGNMLEVQDELNYFFLFVSLLLVLTSLFIKSSRWAVILRPVTNVDQRTIFPISCIGIAAITIMPLRLGEVVRPYLITKVRPISFSMAIASIVFERFMDTLMLVLLLSALLILSNLPDYIVTTGQFLSIFALFTFLIIVIFYRKRGEISFFLKRITFFLPKKLQSFLINLIVNFLSGMSILSSPLSLIKTLLLSTLLWSIYLITVYSMFSFHNFDLPIMAASLVVLITLLASSLPAAPGFLGTFQYGCFLALTSYGIPNDQAALFSLTYYFVMIGPNILLGLICIIKSDFKISSLPSGKAN